MPLLYTPSTKGYTEPMPTETTTPTAVILSWSDVVDLMTALQDDRDHWTKLAIRGGDETCTAFIARRLADTYRGPA